MASEMSVAPPGTVNNATRYQRIGTRQRETDVYSELMDRDFFDRVLVAADRAFDCGERVGDLGDDARGIPHARQRNEALAAGELTKSQLIGQAMSNKAVSSGKVTAVGARFLSASRRRQARLPTPLHSKPESRA